MQPLESIQPQRERERERMRGSSPPRSFSIKTITPSPYRSRVHHRADDSVDENGASGRVAGTQLSLRRERREKGAKRTCNYHRVEGVTPKRRREEAKKRLEGKNNTVLSPSSLLREGRATLHLRGTSQSARVGGRRVSTDHSCDMFPPKHRSIEDCCDNRGETHKHSSQLHII